MNIDEETDGILEDVYEEYGQYTAWKLRNMTHEESPWLDTPRNEIITKDKIKSCFKTKVS